MKTQDDIELLFIQASSKDARGRRVMVREGVVENWLWPEDMVTEFEAGILGLTESQMHEIEDFFDKRRDNGKDIL